MVHTPLNRINIPESKDPRMQQRSKIFPIKRTQPFREAPNLRSRIPLNLSVCSALTLILMLVGCTDGETPIPSILHTLEINSVTITTDTLETGNTATVTVLINYSGEAASLTYSWKATGGKIVGKTATVTYLAPDAPGTYTITLQLTDGLVSAERSIAVEVVDVPSLPIGSGTYWEGNGFTQSLKYQVDVTKILAPNVKLRYEIRQDKAREGAFLTIRINNTSLVDDVAIGAVQPVEVPVIQDELDVSKLVTTPGKYEITFTLVVVSVVAQGWELQNASLIGVEGTATRL
jgi:hypothetical protein